MSTRLLTSPGKAHALCDDLESLWFVILFESLHFVKHNKPDDVNMAAIFDDLFMDSAGNHKGGAGKINLYHNGLLITRMLKFDSTPFTTLVRDIYKLFRSLESHYVSEDEGIEPSNSLKENYKKLTSCATIKNLLMVALSSEGWPEVCDKVEDQYPPTGTLTIERRKTIGVSYESHLLVPSGGKRKREEEDDPTVLIDPKRPKVAPLWKQAWSKCINLVWS